MSEKLPSRININQYEELNYNIVDSANKIQNLILKIIEKNNLDTKKIAQELKDIKLLIEQLHIKIDTLIALKNNSQIDPSLDLAIESLEFLVKTSQNTQENLLEKLNELNNDNKNLKWDKELLEKQLNNDALTWIYNRRCFNRTLETAFNLAGNKHTWSFCCAMIDIDNFKYINDNYGHVNWDIVLQKISEILNQFSKIYSPTKVFRYGWEEFAVLSKLPAEKTEVMLNEILEHLKNNPISLDDQEITLSFSAWVTNFNKKYHKEAIDIVQQSDRKLCLAKKQWKSQVII